MISRLVLEYDGGGFAGWARQPGQRTVQAEVERALSVVLRTDIALTVAGRTDAGVHALGQVCSYQGEPAPVERMNALLPADIAVLSCSGAPGGFDARRDATSRAYCYRVLSRPTRSAFWSARALHWPHRIEISGLEDCAAALAGTHDFTAFTPTETAHVRFERDVFSAFWRAGEDDLLGEVLEQRLAVRGAAAELVSLTLVTHDDEDVTRSGPLLGLPASRRRATGRGRGASRRPRRSTSCRSSGSR